MGGILSSDRLSAALTDHDQAPVDAGPLVSTEERNLWQAVSQGDIDAKQTLVLKHQQFARYLAASAFGKRHDASLEFDDFYQYALIGLIEAIERYDPEKGASFTTFATYRIKGAILNGVEKLTEQQQQINARKRILSTRAAALKDPSKKPSSLDDLFGELASIAIGLAIGNILEGSGLYRSDEEESIPESVYTRYELKQLSEQIRVLVDTLAEKERLIIKLHYFHGIKFDNIAKEMGLSKGRISQLHRAALTTLSQQYAHTSSIDKKF